MNKYKIISFIAANWMKGAYALSLSVKRINMEPVLDLVNRKQSFILAHWHNRMFQTCHAVPAEKHCFYPMMSQSRDGEYVSRTVKRMGYFNGIRGSSTRGGSDVTKNAIKILKNVQGSILPITPDGPTGPKYRAKKGAVVIARASGVPIIPYAYNASKKLVLNTWDNLILPLPCGHQVYVYGDPVYMDKHSRNADECIQVFENALNKVTDIADNWEF